MVLLINALIPPPTQALQSTQGDLLNFEMFQGKKIILYFYPKNNTPGCTTETMDFVSNYSILTALNTCIFGVSRDSLSSHEAFRKKLHILFDLISDTQENLCTQFDVIRTKTLYGKPVRSIERSTFIFNETGHLIRQWRNVKVDGHVNDIVEYIRTLT